MLVGNDVTVDTRVKKMAVSLAAEGLRVTVLGISTTGRRVESDLHGARVVRLPVVDALRRQRRVLPAAPALGYRSKRELIVAKRRQKIAEREVTAAAGRARAQAERLQERAGLPGRAASRALRWSIRARRTLLRSRRAAVSVREALYRRRLERDTGRPDPLAVAAGRVRTRLRLGGWRRVLPELHDYELAFGSELDALEPDVIHAHDVHMIGIAERAAARARNRGRTVRWVYDAHEYVPGLPRYGPRELNAYIELEREYVRRADRVITVSDPIADVMTRSFGLPRRPTVVMNIPVAPEIPPEHAPSVRRAAGLHDDVPLLVYSGGINRARGVETLIDALPLLPGVHVALVSRSGGASTLERRATELGCRHRLHVVPFVAGNEVPAYLSSATAGVSALLHCGNHEVALPNKLFEYLHAGLPLLVSDVLAMAEFTRRHGVGEVFAAGDPGALATAARKVLADRDAYTRALREPPGLASQYTWAGEAAKLTDLYRDLLGPAFPPPSARRAAPPPVRAATRSDDRAIRLGIGPRNMAGQAWAWARAVERWAGGVDTESFALERNSPLVFPADLHIPAVSWKDLDWQFARVRQVFDRYTHLLLESGTGVFGTLNGGTFTSDLPALRAHGLSVAVVMHGSEARSPRLHRELEPWSPFVGDVLDPGLPAQEVVDRLLWAVQAFDGPRFVSTLDLLDYVPDAAWLPVVIDPGLWRCDRGPLERARPVVVHAPSHTVLKGSAHADAVGEELAARGVIEYRRLRDVPPADMPAALADADVVLDQFALGDYGVLACQAMAAGRVVVGHVADRVRKRLPAELPIVQATPADLRDVLLRIVEERDAARATAAEGVEFVRAYHDGRHAVAQLRPFLTGEGS